MGCAREVMCGSGRIGAMAIGALALVGLMC